MFPVKNMGYELLKKIEDKKEEGATRARLVASTNPTLALQNFNQIKGREYDKKTYLRRHGKAQDEVSRHITLVEFTVDFFASAFAYRPNAAILTDFVMGLSRVVEDGKLPARPKTVPEIEDDLTELHRQFRKAVYQDYDQAEAKRLSILIQHKSNELVEVTHDSGAFALGAI